MKWKGRPQSKNVEDRTKKSFTSPGARSQYAWRELDYWEMVKMRKAVRPPSKKK